MKIVLFTEYFPPKIDGIGDYTFLLAKKLVMLGIDTTVITLYTSNCQKIIEEVSFENINVLKLNIYQKKFYYNEVFSLIQKISPDIACFQVAISASKDQRWVYSILKLPGLIKRNLPNVKVVFTLHQYPCQFINFKNFTKCDLKEMVLSAIKHFYSLFMSKLCNYIIKRRVDYVCIADEYYRKFIDFKNIEFLPIPSNIPYIEVSEFEIKNLKQKYQFSDDEIIIGYFGKIFQEKNFEAILYLLREIPNAKLLYIGKMTGNKIVMKKIDTIIKKFGLYDKIKESGYLSSSDVAKHLQVVDVYVSLFKEGVSTKNASFLAAVMQGIFCVVTSKQKYGYYPEENVFYVPPPGDNVSLLKEIILKYKGKKIKPNFNLWPSFEEIALKYKNIFRGILLTS